MYVCTGNTKYIDCVRKFAVNGLRCAQNKSERKNKENEMVGFMEEHRTAIAVAPKQQQQQNDKVTAN